MSCDANIFTVPIPGPPGVAGADGAAGANGHNTYTLTTSVFTMPAEGFNVIVNVADSNAFALNQIIFASGANPDVAYMQVVAIPNASQLTLKNIANTGSSLYLINAIAGTVFPSGSAITTGGIQGPAGSAAGGAPSTATYITQTPDAGLSSEQALSLLATGILKSTTATGVVSIAAQGTDYYAPGGTDVAVADGGTGASTAANARTNLGLVIGTDVQAQDAGLQSLSALPTVADRIAYSTAADTWAETPLTGFIRTLLDDPDLATAQTTLGIGGSNGLLGRSLGVNANSAATDTAITMLSGNYIIERVIISSATTSLTTATAGLFTAAGGAGTTLCADQALVALTGSTRFLDLAMELVAGTDRRTDGTLYFRIGTAQGAPATLNVYIYGRSLS